VVLQNVSFVANKPGPPPSPPLEPSAQIALKVIGWVVGVPWAAAATYVAFMNAGFLAGAAATWPGLAAGIFGGIISALGLSILLVAGGATWQSLRPVSIMAFSLFGLCLWLALSSAGGFSYFTSHPLPVHEKPDPRFDAEPRHPATVDRAVRDWRSQEREYRGSGGWTVVTNGDEIEARTQGCRAFHYAWERGQCDEFAYLQAERKKSAKLYGEPASEDSAGMAAIFSPGALSFGRHFSAWYSHYIFVAWAAVGGAILFGCAYVLTMGPVPAVPVAAPPSSPPAKTETERAFENWAGEYLLPDSSVDTPTELLRIAYRLKCLSAGWPEYNAEPFSRKLASWTKENLKTFERETKRGPAYVGIGLIDDDITRQARRSYENGAA
jgi:hypothetical protein